MPGDDNWWNGKDFIRGLQGSTDHPDEGQNHKNGHPDQEGIHQKICEPKGKSPSGHASLLIRLLPEVTELDEGQGKKNNEIQIRHRRGITQAKITKSRSEERR